MNHGLHVVVIVLSIMRIEEVTLNLIHLFRASISLLRFVVKENLMESNNDFHLTLIPDKHRAIEMRMISFDPANLTEYNDHDKKNGQLCSR